MIVIAIVEFEREQTETCTIGVLLQSFHSLILFRVRFGKVKKDTHAPLRS